MAIRCHTIIAVGIGAMFLGGCSLNPFAGSGARSAQPAPLASAPTGSVTSETLPPLGTASAADGSGQYGLDPNRPAPPSTSSAAGSTTASAAPGDVAIGRTDLLGGWTIAAAGNSCQLFMTLTTWAGGYRASTRECVDPMLQSVSAWNMEGGQVQLLNDAGATVARLYPQSKTYFTGQTPGGGPVTVSR